MTGPPLLIQKAGNVQAILELLGIFDDSQFELLPVVLPIIQFERPKPSELERAAIGFGEITGAAAEKAHLQIFNPAGSGILLQLEIALVEQNVAGGIQLTYHDTALTTLNTGKIFRDRRIDTTPAGQVREVSSAAALGTRIGNIQTVANETVEVPLGGFVLKEGQGLLLAQSTDNKNLGVTYYWTETAA